VPVVVSEGRRQIQMLIGRCWVLEAGGSRSRVRVVIAVTLLAFGVAACGTRLPHGDFVAAAGGGGSRGVASGAQDLTGQGSDTNGSAGVGAASSTGTGAAGGAGTTGGGASVGAAQGGAGGAAGAGGGGLGSPANGSPIILGSVGNYSGPAGSIESPPTKVLQAWANTVNSRGGVSGHPVKVVVVDDQSDPTRYRSALQDLVENQHAVAFMGNFASLTAQGGADYLAQKRVPVLGGDEGNETWWSSPMYFPFGANSAGIGYGDLSAAKGLTSNRKLGTIECQESQGCKDTTSWINANAGAQGWQLVYQGQGSIAAPDFTSQCLSARNAGAQVLYVAFDTNSEQRIANSCDRQGYHPLYILGSADDTFGSNQSFAGALTISFAFPFTYGGPETGGYLDAVRRYAPGTPLGLWSSQAWASGKLFEKIVANIKGPVTSQAILDQLSSFNGETMSGLLPPLTFPRNQPAPTTKCTFAQVMRGGKWVPLNGMTPICAP
jgi:branched-chain amino acid transport system substrate-binding protein